MINRFTSLLVSMFMAVLIFFNSLFKKKDEKNDYLQLPLNLQFFADEDSEDEKEEEDEEEDGPDLDELMKDPVFKKKYQAKLKEQLGKRMKKFKDVDPEEYRRLKEQADKKKAKDKDDEDEELESLKSETKAQEKRLLRAERREKQAVVKEFAVDNGVNAKLLARLIDIDAVELDDDGEPENLEDLFEELQDEFPEYFGEQDEDEEDEEEEIRSKKKNLNRYAPGSKQKGNKKREKDKRAAGAKRAAERHKKENK